MSPPGSRPRQDPFTGLGDEAVDDLTTGQAVPALQRPPTRGRRTPIRPSEKRRRDRKLTITFSNADIPGRVRALARRWGLYAPGGAPNISAVIEHLLLPQLAAAERGEVEPPAVNLVRGPTEGKGGEKRLWF